MKIELEKSRKGYFMEAYQNKLLLVEVKDNVALVTLNNPPLNILTLEVSAEMRDTFHKLEEDEDVRVIVLRGSGQKAFCVGADIKEFPKVWDDVIGKKLMNENLAIDAIELLDKPVIAALEGNTLGGGCEIAMAADIRIMSETGHIGLPEINLGVFPGSGGLFRLARYVGVAKAYELLYTGHIMDATMIVQASAATMAITLIMCANGWISFELGAALVLGENIGTTITANLAALTGNTQARRAALAHLVFNVFGVIWVLCLFVPFTQGVSWFVENIMGTKDPAVAVSFKLSAFHTCFNICNVLILIWFVKFIERTVCAIIPQKEQDEEYRLRFITGGMLSTAELSILQASKEIHLFAERTHRMFGMVRDLLHTEKDDDFNKLFSRIEKYENISDSMELEIANYLNQVSEGRLSSESKLQIRAMLREVTEIESIGDSCYNLARTINRKRQTNQEFTEKQYEHIHFMMKLTDDALGQMIVVVERSDHQGIDVNKSFNIENEINNYRNQLKNQNILDVNNKEYDYQMGVYYMDIIAECEKLGDYVVNVVEASSDIKEKKAS